MRPLLLFVLALIVVIMPPFAKAPPAKNAAKINLRADLATAHKKKNEMKNTLRTTEAELAAARVELAAAHESLAKPAEAMRAEAEASVRAELMHEHRNEQKRAGSKLAHANAIIASNKTATEANNARAQAALSAANLLASASQAKMAAMAAELAAAHAQYAVRIEIEDRRAARVQANLARARAAVTDAKAIAHNNTTETQAACQAGLDVLSEQLQEATAQISKLKQARKPATNHKNSTLHTENTRRWSKTLHDELQAEYSAVQLEAIASKLALRCGKPTVQHLAYADLDPRWINMSHRDFALGLKEHLTTTKAVKIQYCLGLSRTKSESVNHILWHEYDEDRGWVRSEVRGVQLPRLAGRRLKGKYVEQLLEYFTMEGAEDGLECHMDFIALLEHEIGNNYYHISCACLHCQLYGPVLSLYTTVYTYTTL
jgi:hypothetical protein